MPRSPTGAHGSRGDSNSAAARSASVTPSTSGPPPDIARRSLTNLGFRSFPLTAGSGNADEERPRRRRRLGLGAARIPWVSPLSIGVPLPLTQADLDYFTHYNAEPLNVHLLCQAPGHATATVFQSFGHNTKLFTFHHIWQKKSKEIGFLDEFYSYLGVYTAYPYPPLTFPWSTSEQFLARWRELYP